MVLIRPGFKEGSRQRRRLALGLPDRAGQRGLGGSPGTAVGLNMVLVLGLAVLLASSRAADTPDWDPRLGAPFAKRQRAVLGPDSAKVIVIEFSSFRCTHCRSFQQQVFPALRRQYVDTGKVQWVVIDASNEESDRSSPVFLAAQAALQRGRYWELADQLYDVGVRPPAYFARLVGAGDGAPGRSLAEGLQDPSVRAAVAADFSDYAALRIRGTPTFLLRQQNPDGRWTRGILEDTQTLNYFQRVLDGLLAAGRP